ncbi:MAG: CofH family radical SAM protein [Desulfomicrobium sp.]|jgi:aminodeoxyfutalosine synthase|nr:CofH family radical SAM protein [Desulfomicrobium sp.]NLV97607.1 CofH family radical SAM protein [Desulfovibrionales bacterium]
MKNMLPPTSAQRLASLKPGERIDPEFALEIAQCAPIHSLGEAALRQRRARHSDKAYYVYNQHLNYTNICRNQCRFCAYSKRQGEAGGYTYSLDQARQLLLARIDYPIREIHIVGGLNPDLPYAYYLDLLSLCREIRPQAIIKAFTAVEVAYFADLTGRNEATVLEEMRESGLQVLPGGGAEVFSPAMRAQLCPEKISAKRWLYIHGLAHDMGIQTNCTVLFGHIETWEDRIHHLEQLRQLQDEHPGFICFIPLAYQPLNNALSAPGPTGEEYLRMIAISRLFLDNIAHIKAYWAFAGIKAAQMALWAGADDFDGTIVEEKIGHAAGADSPRGLTITELFQIIEATGFIPVQRDTYFNEIHS